MPQLSTEASDFNWLVGNFANRTPGVAHAPVHLDHGLFDQSAVDAAGTALVRLAIS
jgi:hypothetical protein